MSALRDYIGTAAAENLRAQLPGNRIQVVSNEFLEGDSNKINIRLKVYAGDVPLQGQAAPKGNSLIPKPTS